MTFRSDFHLETHFGKRRSSPHLNPILQHTLTGAHHFLDGTRIEVHSSNDNDVIGTASNSTL